MSDYRGVGLLERCRIREVSLYNTWMCSHTVQFIVCFFDLCLNTDACMHVSVGGQGCLLQHVSL